MKNSERIWDCVDEHAADYTALSDRVWAMPELAYGEFRSAEEHRAMLEAEGFRITTDPAGIPTALVGELGEDGPVFAFLGEYDALPGLSQEAGADAPVALPGNGNGHGCGHNMLGSAALLGAVAFAQYLKETGQKGRVRYYGCPAEEGGAAKAFMVRAGLFEDVDAAVTWHPATITRVDDMRSLANTRIDFTFHGRSSHAAAAPHLGRSALDGVELMNIGANYLREHIPQECRLHYAVLDAGGSAPNVVQARATVRYQLRAVDLATLLPVKERILQIASGAAQMSGTTVEHHVRSGVSNMLENPTMTDVMAAVMDRLGPVPYDAADYDYARRLQATMTDEDIEATYLRAGIKNFDDMALCDIVVPKDSPTAPMMGSTDVGDVSWVVPTVQCRVGTWAIGTPGHSWQVTAQGTSGQAHKGLIHAAKIMAGTAVELLEKPELLAAAKADMAAIHARTPYICPIPEGVPVPIIPRPANLAAE
ncbi:amidohydrolase [Pseudooceanicola sp. GBMRC 2024]|uniref:Amidohydrolase n=1 Tax=Pseudooceanicola albus TaxID=2692189 RepID=A0A6L7G3E1_9RHOB|nr:amidohydrolase [Pseudooceanicola albus]MXN17956.1 amidohydrolase [Pseudooceanicola albus]